jgi:chlorobactene glucosyltransferase
MLSYFLQSQVLQIILFQVIILLFIMSNAWYLRRARKHTPSDYFPKVSVLVPARNEERVIRSCVQSLLAQDYASFEVLVLDDQSSDTTRAILEQVARENPCLRVLDGSTPPAGLPGKNWACAQLAGEAQGELLFFTDADTLHQPNCLREVVRALQGEQADMLTGFPRQEMYSWGERLLVPFFSWAVLSFYPLGLAYKLRLPALSAAVGQMMLFQRRAYQSIGGHAILDSFVDDMALAKHIKAAGLRWRMANITDLVTCRMYDGSHAAFRGFAKNYFAVFNFRLLPYLFVFTWLGVMFWKPLILLLQPLLGKTTQTPIVELVLCIGLSFLLWLIPCIMLRIPTSLAILYPLIILAVEVIALQSLLLSFSGRLSWKERPLVQPRWKWF